MRDTFYKFGKHDPFEIMRRCHEKSFQIFIDIKDDDYRRTRYDISFGECLDIFRKNKMHWVFIHRNSGYPTYVNDDIHQDCFEVGGCTMNITDEMGINRDVYLFMYLHPEDGLGILNEFNLEKL